jgi:hypothetical protein
MLPQKIFKLINNIALFAIVFASLAPSISHALQANSGEGFEQEVCTTNGEKITIQVLTTKGQQLATELPAQTSQSKSPTGIQHHLQHCPFCANPSTDTALQAPHAPIIAFLTVQTEKQAAITPVVFSSFSPLPPPAQAPPSFN